MPSPNSSKKAVSADGLAITRENYFFLARLLERKEKVQRAYKKKPYGEALRNAGEKYALREHVSAFECFKPVYEKFVSDLQRVLARNAEFEANKLAREQQMPLTAAKMHVEKMKSYAQQVINEFERLRQDLVSKPLVRIHLKKIESGEVPATPPKQETPFTRLNSADDTQLSANPFARSVAIGGIHYRKSPFSSPEIKSLYSVQDKARRERIIQVIGKSPDGTKIQVMMLDDQEPPKLPITLAVESLARQAANGRCSLLLPIPGNVESPLTLRQSE